MALRDRVDRGCRHSTLASGTARAPAGATDHNGLAMERRCQRVLRVQLSVPEVSRFLGGGVKERADGRRLETNRLRDLCGIVDAVARAVDAEGHRLVAGIPD